MTRVIGPLFSLSASGLFQGIVEFRTGGGRTIAAAPKAYIPPRTAAQAEQTNRFKDAISGWRALTDDQKTGWTVRAPAGTTGYRFYISEYFLQNIIPPNQPIYP